MSVCSLAWPANNPKRRRLAAAIGSQNGNGHSCTCNYHTLTGFDFFEQPGELRLSLVHVDLAHELSLANAAAESSQWARSAVLIQRV